MTSRAAADTFQLREIVGDRYEVRERLAATSAGQAFLARDRRRGREVELRVVARGTNGAPLFDEAQMIARNPHPGLPEIFEVSTHAGNQFVVSERVVGKTLASRMTQTAQAGGLELDEALAILVELCDAIALVQRLGLAHDVISPDRVILAAGGRVVLGNIGVIRVERDLPPDSPYASRAPNLRARDCVALGVTVFEVLTGSVPAPWEPSAVQVTRIPEVCAQLRAPVAALLASDERPPPDLDDAVTALRTTRAALRPLSVVIAEPDRGARKLLSQTLRQISPGVTMRFCNDGRALLSLVAAQAPDVVFFDPVALRMDLRDVCASLRRHPDGVTIKICSTRTLAAADIDALDIESIDISPRVLKAELAIGLREITRPRSRDEKRVRPRRVTQRRFASLPGERLVEQPAPVAASTPVQQPAAPAPSTAPTQLGPGVTLAKRYVIEEQLGAGGMGGVFAVRHVDLGKRFALKTLHPTLNKSGEIRARFLEEAKITSQISHPNVVSVVDFGHDPEHGMFLVMELLVGDTLGRFAGRMSLRKTCETLAQITEALDVLHKNGIIHGDIKPDNVMLVEEQTNQRRRTIARLIDFGLAYRMSTISDRDPIAGTPEYMAPERAAGRPASVATDIYALGVSAYELLSGSVPFQGRVEDVLDAHATAEPPPITPQRGEHVDEAVLALVARAMSKEPSQRHPTVSAFRYELNAVMSMLGMTKRAQRARRDPTVGQLFLDSRLPQAVITPRGDIEMANDAYRALRVELGQLVFEHATLDELLARAQTTGAPITSIAHEGPRSLLVLLTPLNDGVHVVIGSPP